MESYFYLQCVAQNLALVNNGNVLLAEYRILLPQNPHIPTKNRHYEQTNWTNCNSINKQKVKFSLPFELLPTPQVLKNVSTSSSLCMLSPSTLVLLAVAKHSCRWFSYNFIYKFFDICCLLNHICGFALCGFSLAKADRIFLSK